MGHRLTAAARYWHTLRHLHPSQVGWRLRYRLRPPRPPHAVDGPTPDFDPEVMQRLARFLDGWTHIALPDEAETEGPLRGRFTFLNKTIQTRTPPWQKLDVSLLWAYHLHYFDYSRDLALRHPDPQGDVARQVRSWVDSWIRENPPGAPVAWDPYTLAVRLLNWSFLAARYGWDDAPLRASMDAQLNALANRLEYDICGNHLMKNAAALTVAGSALNSPHRAAGLALLQREVATQMLPDGGHVERSAMYHGQILLDLVMAAAVLDPVPPWLATAIARGAEFLRGVQHGDGRFAQFNDGAAEEGVAPETIAALAALVCPQSDCTVAGSRAFPDSGIYRLRGAPGETMLVKAGCALADFQPGHAHSDLLSFEYSQDGQRIFVNAGTHGYAESPYRDFCRSTLAHNTVCINGRDQQEHWSTFRVARRVHGTVSAWDEIVPTLHAAYTTLDGVRHERQVAYNAGGFWLICDHLSGRGAMQLENRLHLHPDVDVEALPHSAAGGAYRLTAPGTALLLVVLGAAEGGLIKKDKDSGEGFYFPRFGQAVPAPVIRATASAASSHRMGIAIARQGDGMDEATMGEAIARAWNEHQHAP